MNRIIVILIMFIWLCTLGCCYIVGYDYGYNQTRYIKHVHIWKTYIEMLPNVEVFDRDGGTML